MGISACSGEPQSGYAPGVEEPHGKRRLRAVRIATLTTDATSSALEAVQTFWRSEGEQPEEARKKHRQMLAEDSNATGSRGVVRYRQVGMVQPDGCRKVRVVESEEGGVGAQQSSMRGGSIEGLRLYDVVAEFAAAANSSKSSSKEENTTQQAVAAQATAAQDAGVMEAYLPMLKQYLSSSGQAESLRKLEADEQRMLEQQAGARGAGVEDGGGCAGEYVYDVYTAVDEDVDRQWLGEYSLDPDALGCESDVLESVVLQLNEGLEQDWGLAVLPRDPAEQDSEDSNASGYYANDYPEDDSSTSSDSDESSTSSDSDNRP